jgi:AMMECR1 domain-containing protein
VQKLDSQSFSHISKLDLDAFVQFQQETRDTICGVYPCAVMCALMPAGTNVTALKYYTSQDCISEDSDNSVSYIAIACSGKDWPDEQNRVHLNEDRTITPEEAGVEVTESMKRCFGAFVTIYKPAHGMSNMGHGDKDLRGCIGSMWPVAPLWETVQDNAIAAAVRDPRFPRRIKSKDEIVLGRDGVIFAKSGHNAVFLPHVMTEFGWSIEETLRQLAAKAGLRPDDVEGAKLDIFQSEIIAEDDHK